MVMVGATAFHVSRKETLAAVAAASLALIVIFLACGRTFVVKHGVSPFVGADLETLLRANGIDTLVLADIHTSGVVLSTVRRAGDLDYRLVIVRDCYADPDAEVHAMLLDIVIAKQAAVVTTAELAGALSGRSSRLARAWSLPSWWWKMPVALWWWRNMSTR
jgi:hypothetical protein